MAATYEFFVTRDLGAAEAIMAKRIPTTSQSLSWTFREMRRTTTLQASRICHDLLRKDGFMAVRVFSHGALKFEGVHPLAEHYYSLRQPPTLTPNTAYAVGIPGLEKFS